MSIFYVQNTENSKKLSRYQKYAIQHVIKTISSKKIQSFPIMKNSKLTISNFKQLKEY